MKCMRCHCRMHCMMQDGELAAFGRRDMMAALPTGVYEAAVVEEVRAIVKTGEAHDRVRASARLMQKIAWQKSGNGADGQATEIDEGWLLLLSAISRDQI